MAWHTDKPVLSDTVAQAVQEIRENFQHLDPLAQDVDDLQTVSELAPIANDLQTVSGLAAVADELQAVSGLAPVVEELQAVSGLEPYIQAILDGCIVDHNLGVSSPPNGWYVRWASGLCIAFHSGLATYMNASTLRFTWTFPVEFDALPIVTSNMTDENPSDISVSNRNITCRGYASSTTTGIVAVRTVTAETNSFQSNDTKLVTMVARGVVSS